MDWRLAGPDACLDRDAQLMLLRPPPQPPVEYDSVQPVEGLAHSYGSVAGSIQGAALLADWSDERRGDAGWQCTSAEAVVEEAGEKGGQDNNRTREQDVSMRADAEAIPKAFLELENISSIRCMTDQSLTGHAYYGCMSQ